MINFQEGISKLREAIFIKKGSGQDPSKEEDALKLLESEMQKEKRIAAEIAKGIEEKEKALNEHENKAAAIKEKIIKIVKVWQDLVRELNRHEFQAELAFEERVSLSRQAGVRMDRRVTSYGGRSVHTGSTRTQWVDESLCPLTEDFRREVVSEQGEIMDKKGRPRRIRQPVDSRPRFDPNQYEALMAYGIKLPDSWHAAYARYQKAAEEFVAKNPESQMNS